MKVPARAVRKFIRKHRNYLPFVIVAVGALVAAYILFMPKTAGRQVSVANVNQLATCPEATKFDCYSGYFEKQALTTNPKTALTEMKQLYDNGDGYVISQCHQLAHWVGHAGFKKYGTLAKAYTNGDTFCWSGYYHGVTEEAVGAMGGERIKSEANLICKELADTKQYSFEHYNCVHGLGHGFMAVDSYNLFTSLKTCDLLVN